MSARGFRPAVRTHHVRPGGPGRARAGRRNPRMSLINDALKKASQNTDADNTGADERTVARGDTHARAALAAVRGAAPGRNCFRRRHVHGDARLAELAHGFCQGSGHSENFSTQSTRAIPPAFLRAPKRLSLPLPTPLLAVPHPSEFPTLKLQGRHLEPEPPLRCDQRQERCSSAKRSNAPSSLPSSRKA